MIALAGDKLFLRFFYRVVEWSAVAVVMVPLDKFMPGLGYLALDFKFKDICVVLAFVTGP